MESASAFPNLLFSRISWWSARANFFRPSAALRHTHFLRGATLHPPLTVRTAGERSFPSIPSFPWSAEDKLIPVVLERCYVPFTSAKVVLFLGLFSPFHFHRFLNLFGMCELHLRTFAVAGDHGRKIFFMGVSSAFRQQVQRLGPRCTSDRLHRELVRELARRPPFFCQFVLVTLIQHSLDSSRSRRGAAYRRGQDMEDGGRGTRGSSWICMYILEESRRILQRRDSDKVYRRCPNIAWLHLSVTWLPTSTAKTAALENAWKSTQVILSDARQSFDQAAVDVTPVTAWEHSETLVFRPETRDVTISRRVESLWRSKLFAMQCLATGTSSQSPLGKRDCQRWGSTCVFRTVCQRAAHFLPYCPNAMTFKTSVTSTQSWHCTCFQLICWVVRRNPKY